IFMYTLWEYSLHFVDKQSDTLAVVCVVVNILAISVQIHTQPTQFAASAFVVAQLSNVLLDGGFRSCEELVCHHTQCVQLTRKHGSVVCRGGFTTACCRSNSSSSSSSSRIQRSIVSSVATSHQTQLLVHDCL